MRAPEKRHNGRSTRRTLSMLPALAALCLLFGAGPALADPFVAPWSPGGTSEPESEDEGAGEQDGEGSSDAETEAEVDPNEAAIDLHGRHRDNQKLPDPSEGGDQGSAGGGSSQELSPIYVTTRLVPAGVGEICQALAGGGLSCRSSAQACESGTNYEITSGDLIAEPGATSNARTGEDMVTVERIRVTRETNEEEHLGFACVPRGEVGATTADPVVITVTLEEFQRLGVDPLVAHAGPLTDWLPVNMVNVLYAESETQTIDTELLGTPVSVRAIPTSYHWDLGDGNTITTTNPGKPFPDEEITSTYRYEGWYDVTLTTTFRGEFSVNGGEWQDIDGTIESPQIPSRSSRSPSSRVW